MRTRSRAIKRINGAITALDWTRVEATLLSPTEDEDADEDADRRFHVCDVSLEDWERFVQSESQALVSRAMAFEAGSIYIVELPSRVHEGFCGLLNTAVLVATGSYDDHLVSRGSSYVDCLEKLEPDCSFGPACRIGAVRPSRMTWIEYHTLKVEVGVSRGWPRLDQKADQWRRFPGVEYILCIRLSPTLGVRQYKLYTVDDRATPLPRMDPIPIVDATSVTFDSRRLLGLVGQAPIPQSFTQPTIAVHLYPLIERLIQENQ